MKTLLLTGGTGFLGSHMLVSEAKAGTRILASVRDGDKLRRLIASEGILGADIIPLGADPSTWGDIKPTHALLSAGVLFARDRETYHSVNVDWTLRVLEALPVDCRAVVVSSQAAGGPTPKGVVARREVDVDTPITLYGKSKLELERAVRVSHSKRPVTILRPPMILGGRDTATLPLFKMAAGLVRAKPGLRKKEYSFIAVEDTVQAVHASWESGLSGPFYIAAENTITDVELIDTAARVGKSRGITLPLPHLLVKCFARIVDAIPHLRASVPSLTRDRALDIWADRWVVDSSLFRKQTQWTSTVDLEQGLQRAYDFYVASGMLNQAS